jgi:phosphomannomutase
MILPAAHYGRDGLVAVALLAQALSGGGTLRELAARLPRYEMVKDKLARPDEPWQEAADRLRREFADHTADEADGLRFAAGESWVHVRPSGTEPVVRVIAETPDADATRALVERARRALAG